MQKFLNKCALILFMGKIELGRELDSYLARIKKPSSHSFLKSLFASKQKSKAQEQEDMVPQTIVRTEPVEVQPSVDVKDFVAKEYDDKKSVFFRMFSWLANAPPELHDAPLESEVASVLAEKEMLADMRELARISISTFRQLPVRKIRDFKASPEFVAFRSILKKHNL